MRIVSSPSTAGDRSGCPRTAATGSPARVPGPGRDRAAVPGARPRPARRACPQPPRGRTGPRSATPQSAARYPADRAARPRAGPGRSDAIAATAWAGPAAGAALPSRPGSYRWRTRRPGPRSGCGPPRPRALSGPAPASWSRGTYVGSSGSPAGASSGWTGRCTSSANGSLTSASGHPAGSGPAPGPPGRAARPTRPHRPGARPRPATPAASMLLPAIRPGLRRGW